MLRLRQPCRQRRALRVHGQQLAFQIRPSRRPLLLAPLLAVHAHFELLEPRASLRQLAPEPIRLEGVLGLLVHQPLPQCQQLLVLPLSAANA